VQAEHGRGGGGPIRWLEIAIHTTGIAAGAVAVAVRTVGSLG
jgi:hypothetical protein